jgi:hypothetical protein
MLFLDENVTRTKAFKEQLDQHAEILFGDGKEAPRKRKPLRVRLGRVREAVGKILHSPPRGFSQPDYPTVE